MLKNKDGTPYTLRSPNPLTKDQFWNELVLHNFVWDYIDAEETIIKREKRLETPHKPVKRIPEPEKQPELPPEPEKPSLEISEPVKETEPVKEVETFIPIRSSLKEDRKILKNTVLIHCLPFKKGGYGKKFAFEGVVSRREDFGIVFWTPVEIETLSVVYPSVYVDGNISFGDYQWWKIDKVSPKNGGFVVHGIVSDIQPDFS